MRVLILLLLFFASAFASDSDEINSRLQSGLSKLYNLEYQSALSLSDSIIREWPEHPAGYLFRSIIHFHQYASGIRNSELKQKIIDYNNKTVSLAKRHENKLESLFFRGAAFGNLCLFYGAESEWIKGLRFGLQAKSFHEKVLKIDPKFYDAYFFLGLFNYYRDTLPKVIRFLPGFLGLKSNSEKGLEQLYLASKQSTFSKVEAATFLGNFYIEKGNYESALEIYAALTKLYPNNPFYIFNQGRTQFLLEDYNAAHEQFLLAESMYKKKNEPGRLISAYFLGRINMLANNFESAVSRLSEIIAEAGHSDKIQFYDGWLLGDAYFYKAECFEFLSEADSAKAYYRLAVSVKYASDGIVQGSKNRLKYGGLSEFELKVKRQINLIKNKSYQDGIAGLKTILAIDDSSGEREKFDELINFYLGKASFELKDIADAQSYFRQIIARNPKEDYLSWLKPTAQYYIAQCYLEQAQPELALEFLEKALNASGYNNENRILFLSVELKSQLNLKSKGKSEELEKEG